MRTSKSNLIHAPRQAPRLARSIVAWLLYQTSPNRTTYALKEDS